MKTFKDVTIEACGKYCGWYCPYRHNSGCSLIGFYAGKPIISLLTDKASGRLLRAKSCLNLETNVDKD